MNHSPLGERDEVIVRRAIARLRAGIMAISFGMTGGVALCVATLWLVIRGGPNVGQHLVLLRNYLPGYTVTWVGAVIGLVYGTLLGAGAGAAVAWVYNRIAMRRQGPMTFTDGYRRDPTHGRPGGTTPGDSGP